MVKMDKMRMPRAPQGFWGSHQTGSLAFLRIEIVDMSGIGFPHHHSTAHVFPWPVGSFESAFLPNLSSNSALISSNVFFTDLLS